MISFGKVCITSGSLAKRHLPVWKSQGIRVVDVYSRVGSESRLCDSEQYHHYHRRYLHEVCGLSILPCRHTSVVEQYLPTIANCMVDMDVTVRIHALSIISKLLLVGRCERICEA